jgi:sarcosine oxidase subunit alpha
MTRMTYRVDDHPVLGPAPERRAVTIYFNGEPLQAYAGDVLAAALLAHGIRTLRRTGHDEAPRGLYCGIGHCFECQVTVDDRPGVRACLTPVRDGMRVETGQGLAPREGHAP